MELTSSSLLGQKTYFINNLILLVTIIGNSIFIASPVDHIVSPLLASTLAADLGKV